MSRRKRQSPAGSVLLTQRAHSDLCEIETYSTKEWGHRAAETYLNDISDALDRLRECPELLRLEPDLAPGLFFYRVRKQLLVCDLCGQTVTVLAVVHTSMDLPSRLSDLEPRLASEAEILQEKLRRKRHAQTRPLV